MTEDMPEDQTNQTEQQPDEQDGDTTDTGGTSGQAQPANQGLSFTAQQQDYLNKLLADERRNALRRFKDSDEFKNISSRAQQANEVDELRAKVQRLETEKAGALVRAEGTMLSAQLRGEMLRRGVPAERIDDALILVDKSNVKVNWDDGSISGAEEAVQALIESRSWLVGPGVGAITTTAGRPAPNLNGGTRGTSATEEAQIQQAMREMSAQGIGRI
jgi:hypothetical protein